MIYHKYNIDLLHIENWIDSIGLRAIRESDKVQRLKKVRFLGTMPYIVKMKANYSRYDHTLHVAKIADAIGIQLEASEQLRRLIVIAALLHDIGHLPFSHASEVFFRQTWGKYHTGHGSRLTYHIAKSLKLTGLNKLAEDVKFANNLLQGKSRLNNAFEDSLFYHVFHGPLSADTLDGILRAAESIGLEFTDISDIISGLVKRNNHIYLLNSKINYVYDFLNLKKKVYTEYVYSTKGMAVEAIITRFLELTFKGNTDRNDFISLDDNSAIEKVKYVPNAFELYNKLESGDLFYSLRDYSPDKYKLLSDTYKRISNYHDSFQTKKSLESDICKKLCVSNTDIILHASIKLKFWNNIVYQQDLFDSLILLNSISKRFIAKKVFGKTIDLFFNANLISKILSVQIPSNLNIINNNTNYIKKVSAIEQHSGAYMTPENIAKFVSSWAIDKNTNSLIDPSSGEGVFLKESYRKLKEFGFTSETALNKIYGVESDINRWRNSIETLGADITSSNKNIINKNFFDLLRKNELDKYDAVIGNPPYIRFHRFAGEDRELALKVAKQLTGITLSKRSSSWAPYLLCAIQLLNPNGKLGMVLPFELLTTDYADPIRNYLRDKFKSLTFVFFNKNIFPSEQVMVFLLLASNEKPYGDFKLVLNDDDSLLIDKRKHKTIQTVSIDWPKHKWTNKIVNNQDILYCIRKLFDKNRLVELKSIAKPSIGLVTGNNSYFILNREQINKYNIDKSWLLPIITKARHVKGLYFNNDDFLNIYENNGKCYLLYIPPSSDINSESNINQYLEQGKRDGVDQTYKCRTRWPWYSVPMKQVPSAFLTYMSGKQVRLSLNDSGAHSNNTIHNINFDSKIDINTQKALIISFYCSITQLSLEIIGRSYGGGVLKLEIGEAEKILLPDLLLTNNKYINDILCISDEINEELRQGTLSNNIIRRLDDIILRRIMGLSEKTCTQIRDELQLMRNRRLLYH
ncbi:MAG: N-6 DNA methylase [Thermodesulfobacteriota bacterium]